MKSIFDFKPHIRKAKMVDEMILLVCEDLGMDASKLMSEWPRHLRRDTSGHQRLCLHEAFGLLRTSTTGAGYVDLCPWRDFFPSRTDNFPYNPHHDLFDIEMYLRGMPTPHQDKYILLDEAGKLWDLYTDCLNFIKINYFHQKLGEKAVRLGEKAVRLGEKAVRLGDKLHEVVNYMTFGTPYDPRINPLLFDESSLRAGVFEWAPGYLPCDEISTKDLRNSLHSQGITKYNKAPWLHAFVACIKHIHHMRTQADKGPGSEAFCVLAPPGCSPNARGLHETRTFLRSTTEAVGKRHDVNARNSRYYKGIGQELVALFLTVLLQEDRRQFLLPFDELSTIASEKFFARTKAYDGSVWLDLDGLVFWAIQANLLGKDNGYSGVSGNASLDLCDFEDKAGMCATDDGGVRLNPRWWLRITDDYQGSESVEIYGETLDQEGLFRRLYGCLNENLGLKMFE